MEFDSVNKVDKKLNESHSNEPSFINVYIETKIPREMIASSSK